MMTYDWKIKTEKPLLRYFSFLMKPLFSVNHRWAMARSEESLKLELARCHAVNQEEFAPITAPLQPTVSSPLRLLPRATAVFALLGGVFYLVAKS
jgi:hypothetical protein